MSALYEGRKFDRDPYCVIPEEIAVQKLYLHQAALDSIEVSESEVIQRVDYMTKDVYKRQALYSMLKDLRKKLSKKLEVPPYVIFQDQMCIRDRSSPNSSRASSILSVVDSLK